MTPDEKREYMRRWWAAHPGYKRLYRLRNHERILAQDREQHRRTRLQRPEKVRAWKRAARNRNIESARKREKAYLQSHPEIRREIQIRYKARKRGATGRQHTLTEWQEKRALLGNVCFYCGEAKPLERDHKVPLSRGGSDAIENLLPACRACNLRKSSLTAREYLHLEPISR